MIRIKKKEKCPGVFIVGTRLYENIGGLEGNIEFKKHPNAEGKKIKAQILQKNGEAGTH